jgi:DNA end-binding protein Ku
MRDKGIAALGRVMLAKRERVIMIQPWDAGLMGTTLRYPYEIRDAKEYLAGVPDLKVDAEMLKLADQILQSKAAKFEPSQFVDRYEEAVVDMLKTKQAGQPVSREQTAPPRQTVLNLMDALRRSIVEEKTGSAAPTKGRKRTRGQVEMLLPIPGKKGKDAAAKPAGRSCKKGRLAG